MIHYATGGWVIRQLPIEFGAKSTQKFLQCPESQYWAKMNVQHRTSNIERRIKKQTSTLGILGTLAHFRHFSGLSGLGLAN